MRRLPRLAIAALLPALDEQGRWVETGERSAGGGQSWQPFFGMTLTRK
ncbi:MAG TPA: hypothetical protein VNJ70_01405 [Thermoanaerobaculia bacterium]|nr:hypothetical protein [Thermoanaerobaculia bacterium]